MQFELYHWVAKALEILVIGYSLLRGEKPERLGGLAFLLVIIVSPLSQDYRFPPGPQVGLALVDFAYLAAFAVLSIKYNRTWLYVVAGLQVVIMACHLLLVVDPKIRVWIYIAFMNLLSYVQMFSIAYGTWQADRRRFAAAAAARADNAG